MNVSESSLYESVTDWNNISELVLFLPQFRDPAQK